LITTCSWYCNVGVDHVTFFVFVFDSVVDYVTGS
jgi:hypothetical protein